MEEPLMASCLLLLKNCSSPQEHGAKIKDQCLPVAVNMMKKHTNNAALVYVCFQLIIRLDHWYRVPPVGPDVIATWARLIDSCYYDPSFNHYSILLSGSALIQDRASNLFMSFEIAVETYEQRRALAEAMEPHIDRLQEVIINGDIHDKRYVNAVLKGMITCPATCDMDFTRDILVNSGVSVHDIIGMKDDSHVEDRFRWISEQVKDEECYLALEQKLPVSLALEKIPSAEQYRISYDEYEQHTLEVELLANNHVVVHNWSCDAYELLSKWWAERVKEQVIYIYIYYILAATFMVLFQI